MEHITDSDFADPFIPPGTEPSSYSFQANSEALATIVSMGFTPEQATKALKATDNNVERAMDWIFSHMDDLNSDEQDGGAAAAPSTPQFRDGDGSKSLFVLNKLFSKYEFFSLDENKTEKKRKNEILRLEKKLRSLKKVCL